MPSKQLPHVFVNITQPGDKGDFHVNVMDFKTRQRIAHNRLEENLSYFEYVYTARLLEGSAAHAGLGDDMAAKKQRYADLVRYGQRLYRELFGETEAFRTYLEQNGGAQIVLRLHSTASELWNIPWEYAHDGKRFLGIQKATPIMRNLADIKLERESLDMRTLPAPLRILMVISHPRNVAPLNVDAEIAMIRRAVADAQAAGAVEIDFVEEGTLENLENALTQRDYHVLHYSGHGAIGPMGSFLAMEDEQGMAVPVYMDQLLPIIEASRTLRFVFLSACKAGNINETAATSGIATGLMQKVPAVLAMQFTILDDSASKLAQGFYGAIGKGYTLEDAVHIARRVLHKHRPAFGDWGVPTLYAHTPNIRLLDPSIYKGGAAKAVPVAQPTAAFDLSGLPTTDRFVGRSDEQRKMRAALSNREIPMIFIWGLQGMGKSSLVRRVIERPGARDAIDDVLIIRCDKTPDVFLTLANWLAKHYPDAVPMLKQIKADPLRTLNALAQVVRDKRLLIVFDQLDALMKPTVQRSWDVPDPALRTLLTGMAKIDWSILTVITSRFRWAFLAELEADDYLDIDLGSLNPQMWPQIVQTFKGLDKLPKETLFNLYTKVGHHPGMLRFVYDHLDDEKLPQMLDDPYKLGKMMHEMFMGRVFSLLSEEEARALQAISVHGDIFTPKLLQEIIQLPNESAAVEIMVAWESLSLASFVGQAEDETPYYLIPRVVCTYVSGQLNKQQQRDMHRRIAQVMQAGFFDQVAAIYEREERAIPQNADPYEMVVGHLDIVLRRGDIGMIDRTMGLVNTWAHHMRAGGDEKRADRVVISLLEPFGRFRSFERLQALLAEVDDKVHIAEDDQIQIDYWRAIMTYWQGDFDGAHQQVQDLVRFIQGAKNTDRAADFRCRTVILEGDINRSQGDHSKAKNLYRRARSLYRNRKDTMGGIHALLRLAETAYQEYNLREARALINEAEGDLKKYEGPMDPRVMGRYALLKGNLYRVGNKPEFHTAIENYGEARQAGMSIGDPFLVAEAAEAMGYLYGQLRQLELASRLLLEAIDIYENWNDPIGLSVALARLSVIQHYRNNADEAAAFAKRAARTAKASAPAAVPVVAQLMKKLKARTL